MDIHEFLMSAFSYPYNCVYPHIDIQAGVSMSFYVSLQLSIQVCISTLISKQGYPCKDTLQWVSVNNEYPWIDIHVYGCPSSIIHDCMNILWDILGFLWISMHRFAMDSRSRMVKILILRSRIFYPESSPEMFSPGSKLPFVGARIFSNGMRLFSV